MLGVSRGVVGEGEVKHISYLKHMHACGRIYYCPLMLMNSLFVFYI